MEEYASALPPAPLEPWFETTNETLEPNRAKVDLQCSSRNRLPCSRKVSRPATQLRIFLLSESNVELSGQPASLFERAHQCTYADPKTLAGHAYRGL